MTLQTPRVRVCRALNSPSPTYFDVHYDPTYVVRKDAPVSGKVAVISGSGGGHEPLNTGYVGHGHA